jgi:hypothetical protein
MFSCGVVFVAVIEDQQGLELTARIAVKQSWNIVSWDEVEAQSIWSAAAKVKIRKIMCVRSRQSVIIAEPKPTRC